MRFSQAWANIYRKNGRILVVRHIPSGFYDVIKFVGYKEELITTRSAKHEAVKLAKEYAMEYKLGFDPKQDIVS